jgi:hypothetical protein
MSRLEERERLVANLRRMSPSQRSGVKKSVFSILREGNTPGMLPDEETKELTRSEMLNALVLYDRADLDSIVAEVRKRQKAADKTAREIWKRAATRGAK